MLLLRLGGWSYQALADKYECPKLTIRHLARKHGLGGETVIVTTQSSKVTRTTIYTSITGTSCTTGSDGPINPGKTYAEYVREDQERRKNRTITWPR